MHRSLLLFILLLLTALFSAIIALPLGEITFSMHQLLQLFLGHGNPLAHEIIFDLRAPRILATFTTGDY